MIPISQVGGRSVQAHNQIHIHIPRSLPTVQWLSPAMHHSEHFHPARCCDATDQFVNVSDLGPSIVVGLPSRSASHTDLHASSREPSFSDNALDAADGLFVLSIHQRFEGFVVHIHVHQTLRGGYHARP